MSYVKGTCKYLGKSFWALALVCLPAAVVLGVFTKPMATLSYFFEYAETNVTGFKDMFWLLFSRRAIRHVYPLVLIFATLLFGISLSLSVIEKHFRVGKLQLVSPLKQINNYFLPAFMTLVILTVILLLYGMIQSGILTLLHMLVSGSGKPNGWNVLLAAVISLGLFVLAMFVSCSTMYWTPIMVIYGFSFRDAAAYSFRLIDGKTFGILCGLLLPFLCVAICECLFSFIGNIYIETVLAVLLYLLLILYVAVYVMVSLFGLADMERRDGKIR